MIEKEFKELLNSITITPLEKKDLNSFFSIISNCLKDNCDKNLKLLDISFVPQVNNLLTGTKSFNVYISYGLKNKLLPLQLMQITILNEIVNNILVNVKNNIIFRETLPVISHDIKNNLLRIGFYDYEVTFFIRYKQESISFRSDFSIENKSYFYEDFLIQKEYLELMNKTYPRFYQTLTIINKFTNDLNLEIDYITLSILLGYGLTNYEVDNSYIGYLKVFVHSLTDLIENKTIILNDDIYKSLKVLGSNVISAKYQIIDIANKQNNLFGEEEVIKKYKDLKSYIVTKFPKDGKNVQIDCTPIFVIKDKTIAWNFQIMGTEISNSGGEYDYNSDNYYSCIYKAGLKALQYVVKNKLGNNILVCVKQIGEYSNDIAFPNQLIKEEMEKISYENQSRYANLLAYSKDFDLGLEFKLID